MATNSQPQGRPQPLFAVDCRWFDFTIVFQIAHNTETGVLSEPKRRQPPRRKWARKRKTGGDCDSSGISTSPRAKCGLIWPQATTFR